MPLKVMLGHNEDSIILRTGTQIPDVPHVISIPREPVGFNPLPLSAPNTRGGN